MAKKKLDYINSPVCKMKQLLPKTSFQLLTFLLFCLITSSAKAFRPVAHIIIQRTIAEKLPEGNLFKQAMEKHPDYAAWGAVGPDISYIPKRPLLPKFGYKRKMARLLNNADLVHYYKTGKFCTELVKRAIAAKDERLIAFAAGWITHVAGDFGAHGIFVYPEAGYYINNVEGRDLHSKMEQYAEPIIFIERGGELKQNTAFYVDENIKSDRLYENFFDQKLHLFSGGIRKKVIEEEYEPTVVKLLDEIFNDLFHTDLKTDFAYGMRNYDEAFGKGLSLEAFDLKHYDEGKAYFTDSNQLKEMNDGFDYAIQYALKILKEANGNNYESFLATWNLDVGEIANTLVVKCVIDDESQHGTTHPIKMQLKLKTAQTVALNYNFFKRIRYKRGDVLFAYVHINECDVNETDVYSFQLTKNGKHDDTVIKTLTVNFNGNEIYRNDEKIILNREHPITDRLDFKVPFKLAR